MPPILRDFTDARSSRRGNFGNRRRGFSRNRVGESRREWPEGSQSLPRGKTRSITPAASRENNRELQGDKTRGLDLDSTVAIVIFACRESDRLLLFAKFIGVFGVLFSTRYSRSLLSEMLEFPWILYRLARAVEK